MKTSQVARAVIPCLSKADRTLVRAFLVLIWEGIFTLPDTCETRAALDQLEELMSDLDPDVVETVFHIDLDTFTKLLTNEFAKLSTDDETLN
jgi:hypothetical protein